MACLFLPQKQEVNPPNLRHAGSNQQQFVALLKHKSNQREAEKICRSLVRLMQ